MPNWPFNGREPAAQQTYYSVRFLIADVFRTCDLESGNWNLPATGNDGNPVALADATQWLRSSFLDSLEFGLDAAAEVNSQGQDFGEEKQTLELGREGTDEWTALTWQFDGRGSDDGDGGPWCFVLDVTDADETVVWVAPEVMADGEAVRDAIRKARTALERSEA